MNVCAITGYVGQDPDVRYAQVSTGSVAYANFNVGVSDYVGKNSDGSNKYDCDWIRVELSGRLAELAEAYIRKGMKVDITGKLKIKSFNSKDGNKVTYTYVKVDKMEWDRAEGIEHHDEKDTPGKNHTQVPRSNSRVATPVKREEKPNDGFMEIPDGVDDEFLPFN